MDDLDQRISAAIDAGFTDEEIQEALKGSAPKAGHGRGDELFQPDPSPSGVITRGPSVPQRLADKVNDLSHMHGDDQTVEALPELRRALAGTSTPGARPADDRQEARDFALFAGGGAAGMAAGGAARALGAGARTSGIIGGAASGAAPALANRQDAKDVIFSTLLGAALGGVTSGEGQRRRPGKTEAGRAVNAIEAVGGKPSIRPGRAARGGMFDEKAYRDLPPGDEGTAQMAEEARGKISGDLEARDARNRGELEATENRVEQELGDTLHPFDPLQSRIGDVRTENNNTRSGEPRDMDVERRLSDVERQLAPPAEDPTPGATFGQLRGLQKSLRDAAGYGTPATQENRVPRMLHGAATDAVKSLHPDLPGAYQKYGTEMERLEAAKNAMYGGKGTIRDAEGIPGTQEETARGRLMRHGKSGAAAANTGITLEELAAQDPMYAEQLARLAGRNAVPQLEFGLPSRFDSQGMLRALTQNTGALSERALRPMTGVGYEGGLNIPPLELLLLGAYQDQKGNR